jgi:hypothetical protein
VGLLVGSLFIGFWVTMIVEVPCANLLRIAFERVNNQSSRRKEGNIKKNESLMSS